MVTESSRHASVLIVDSAASIRQLIAIALDHAGFRTCVVEDFAALAPGDVSQFAVIVRDVNLTPGGRERALRELDRTAPEVLRRTIVTTTAPAARATKAIGSDRVFAIIAKPFDLGQLVDTARTCAGTPAELDSLKRFVRSVPSLEDLLSVPVVSQREAVLRAEMRRTMRALSVTLADAAQIETSSTRATVFSAAAMVAARLAGTAASRRDH
ncbi:MAG TPA: hypothetical protein VEK79_11105 [Thermoanaerobaculia bacterium]|nr:hypothetical protein [Thermoanaerobaculia bacterium]